MKVMCVDNEGKINSVTIGKWYKIAYYDKNHDFINVIDNTGVYEFFKKKSFKTTEEIREEKLKQLGI